MPNNPYFHPGDTIVMRAILRDKLWWACPAFVVRDTPALLALHWKVGTPMRAPIRRPTVQDEIDNHIELEYRTWIEHDVLSLSTPGRAHAIDVMWWSDIHLPAWKQSLRLDCWYVQLQEPFRRTSIGFDTMDQILDVVISADRSTWCWKDEDEFAEAEALGLYPPEKIQSIRAEGKHVISLLETNASPFCDGWENWAPPPGWGIPQFPAGWDGVSLSSADGQ